MKKVIYHCNLFNTTKYNKGAGYNKKVLECFLLDLKGNIILEFNSLEESRLFLGLKGSLVKKRCNNGNIFRSKIDRNYYRVVTKNFYHENIDKILAWKSYPCQTRFKYNFIKKVILFNDKKTIEFENRKSAAKFLGVTQERVRQLIKEKKQHKKTMLFAKEIVVDNNQY